MKNHLVALTISTLLISGWTDKQETPQTVFAKVKNNYDKHSSIVYKINYKVKNLDSDDTLQLNANCKLIRNTADPLFNGYIWFLTADSAERYYDLAHIYLLDHKKKKITNYDVDENQGNIITGNIAGNVIKINFLNTSKLLSDVEDTANEVTLLSDNNHFIVTVKYADGDFSERVRKTWIKKDDFVVDKITYQLKFQGQYQYNEWNLSDIEFDRVSNADIDKSIKSYRKSYISQQFKALTEKDYAPLQVGTVAPNFTGANFQNGKEMSLSDYLGQYVVLEFSYMSCAPCVQAIPHLVQIQNEYGTKNVAVLTINSIDNNEKGKKRLPGFITKNSVNYPVILTTRRTDSLYNAKIYPTLYVIDKKGKIIYSHLGFSEALGSALKTILDGQQK